MPDPEAEAREVVRQLVAAHRRMSPTTSCIETDWTALIAAIAEIVRERNESDAELDARRRFDRAIRESTNAMMKEALGAEMYSRLWGVELERLGYACDTLRAQVEALLRERDGARADFKELQAEWRRTTTEAKR